MVLQLSVTIVQMQRAYKILSSGIFCNIFVIFSGG